MNLADVDVTVYKEFYENSLKTIDIENINFWV